MTSLPASTLRQVWLVLSHSLNSMHELSLCARQAITLRAPPRPGNLGTSTLTPEPGTLNPTKRLRKRAVR